MRIGFFSPQWPPNHGGVSIYNHQLAQSLQRFGHEVRIFTTTAEEVHKNNGAIPVKRHMAHTFQKSHWVGLIKNKAGSAESLFAHYEIMNAVHEWAIQEKLDILLMSVPFQETVFFHARELYRSLQASGIRVGALHYDIAPQLLAILNRRYIKSQRSWEEIAQELESAISQSKNKYTRLEHYHRIGSPFFFEPDFVISTSAWSGRFIDAPSSNKSFVCHPILETTYWQHPPAAKTLAMRDILMINPQGRKAPQVMLELIKQCTAESFRILEGGWGNAFETFLPQLKGCNAYLEGRVETQSYIEDIRLAYTCSRLVFFPSYVEGYGMTAIEPMYQGIPVISSNYPAILEAVGDGAYLLCPHRDSAQTWAKGVKTVLGESAIWRNKALKRAQELQIRQDLELQQLNSFLEQYAKK